MPLNQTSAEDSSGYLLISGDGASGSAAPAQTIQVGGTDGTNLRTLSTSTTGILNTQLPIQVTTGTLTSGSSTVVATLQSTGSVNVDVSGTWVGTITVTEVYPSGGRTLGVFALNASPITMNITANGNYRVVGVPISSTLQVAFTSYTSGTAIINIYAAATPYIVQPYSANAANVLVTSYLNDGSGNAIGSTNGGLNVSATTANDTVVTGTITTQDTGSTSTTYFNNQIWYSGTPTTGSVFVSNLSGIESGMIQISGTWTGTLQSEISVDGGTTWILHSIHQIGSATFSSSFTNNFVGSLNLGGKTNFRVRAISAITGTANIRLIQSQNPINMYVANAVKLLDSSSPTSNTQMNIVAASTPVSSTNTAISVGLSPNSPLPAGSNTLGVVSTKTSLTPSTPATQSVGTSSTLILAANANRKGLILSNTTSYQISFGFGAAAGYQYGLTIFPGEKFVMDEFTFYNGAIYAVSSTATYIGIQEFST